jgi:Zn-dependent protease
MDRSLNGCFRVCRLVGIDVYLHWSWLLAAVYEIQIRAERYHNPLWSVAEYLTVVGIVLLHELGHTAACRKVGGTATRLVLWPLGGIAQIRAPARPGAVLWSVTAGPLVNLALVPTTIGLFMLSVRLRWDLTAPDAFSFCIAIMVVNGILLVFNLLPIYPLDGGQITHALLWFVLGRARSLFVVSVIGMAVGVVVLGVALVLQAWWFTIMAVLVVMHSWSGSVQARLLSRILSAPRHEGVACPSCGAAPLVGNYWVCSHCRMRFDTFEHFATCPSCGEEFAETMCLDCHASHPIADWFPTAVVSEGEQAEPY